MGSPNALVPIALAAFVVAVALAYSALPPRRAMLWSMLGGWLFLPFFDRRYSFLSFETKTGFVPAVVLLGSVLFDFDRWRRFRPGWIDLPVVAVCAGPAFTALHNGLGLREAASACLEATTIWGAAYLLGRVYLGHPRALGDYASALVTAALVYVPFCLWEIRMSPHLQYQLYGFRYGSFALTQRFGGYRPTVFMQSGLAVGMFMAAGTLAAYWMWRTRARRDIVGIPLGVVSALLAATTVLCKSTGAILLLGVGVLVLEATRRYGTGVALALLVAVPPVYCTARIAGWDGAEVIELAREWINAERADSMRFRTHNEDLLIEKAMQRPWLGWGRWGRSFVYDEEGQSLGVIVDGRWIIALGMAGLVGLVALGALLALPAVYLLRTFPGRHWGDPRIGPAAALAVIVLLWAVDDLLNSMIAPVFPAAAGALVAFVRVARTMRARAGGATPGTDPLSGPPPVPTT